MKRWRVIFLTIAYVVLTIALFKAIKRGETFAREAWYDWVTKRFASVASGVPSDKCIMGVYKPELPYSYTGLRSLEKTIGTRFNLISIYQAWGSGQEHVFPAIAMAAIADSGGVAIVTWEPWVTDFSVPGLKSPGQRERRCLKDVADGVYDFYIAAWAKAAVAWRKPFFLRFAHEMTNPQYPWSPVNDNRAEDYIRAWWHVHRVFDSLGATNVIWVWCPYKPGDFVYYPGDRYVDWTAMDVFNYGDLLSGDGLRWRSFDQLASPLYLELLKLRKPIMAAEVGCSTMGGSREVWYSEMFAQIKLKFTGIKAVVLFENPADRTSGAWVIDWTTGDDRDAIAGIREGFADGHFAYAENYSWLLSTKKTR